MTDRNSFIYRAFSYLPYTCSPFFICGFRFRQPVFGLAGPTPEYPVAREK